MVEKEPNIETKPLHTCAQCERKLSNLPNGNGMEHLKRKTSDNQYETITACKTCTVDYIEQGWEWFASHPFRKSMIKFPLRSVVTPR